MRKYLIIYFLFCDLFFIMGCSKNNVPEKESEVEDVIDYQKSSLTINWDNSTLSCVAEKGGYARMHRLFDNRLMIVYEDHDGNISQKFSSDNGENWTKATIIVSDFYVENKVKIHVANPEFVQLKNGDLIFGCNFRPTRDEVYPFSIAICKSIDSGISWSEPQLIYSAEPRFTDGCWEPSFLQLPDDIVQVYFANEANFTDSNDQEITVMESSDNGTSWSNNRRVCYRQNSRDGMPVAVLHEDSIYVAIEDNVDGQFKPYIIKTALHDKWESPVLGESSNRKMALKIALPNAVYAGAPYLICTDDYCVLSYQTTENRGLDWEKSTMEVVVSNSPSENMAGATRPFEVPINKEAKWNSLTNMGTNKIAAISSTNFNSDYVGIWMIQGTIISNKLGEK